MDTQPSPFQTVHVLDVSSLASPRMSHEARQDLRLLLKRLAACRMGQLLLRVAVDHRLVIRFAEGSELVRPGGRAAGCYHAGSRTLVLDRLLADDDRLVTLAHELQHFVDGMLGWQLNTVECEVRAQQTEAQVIRQLGLRAHTWGLTAAGQVRHPEDIAAEVRAHPLYRFNVPEVPRPDGRVHPLLDARDVLPPMVSCGTHSTTGGSLRVQSVRAVANVVPIQPLGNPAGDLAAQAARPRLGIDTPTGFDPTPAWTDQSGPTRMAGAASGVLLAAGA